MDIWLARARGDARENSDFDLAFAVSDKLNWSRFVTEIQEDPPSLHRYDLVDFELGGLSQLGRKQFTRGIRKERRTAENFL